MADIILFTIYVESMPLTGEIFFWTSLIIILYAYIGYPVLLMFLVVCKKILSRKHNILLSPATFPVTFIVTAYNEADIIEEKIRNTLAIDYPSELLHIIFITDGSDDLTPAIAGNYSRIQLLHQPQRRGKVSAMNRAMEQVSTPFVIFSDANGFVKEDCISKIMQHYANESVGGVSGEKKILVFKNDGPATSSEGVYWKYESWIKTLDAQLYTTVGAAGELFSFRTSLFTPLPEDTIIEDFVQSLCICMKGKVIRYAPEAVSSERGSPDFKQERERKIRISAGAFQAMWRLKGLLNIFKRPLLSFQYISHRLLRWTLCPVGLVILAISSIDAWFTTGLWVYGVAIFLQILFYLTAFAGWLFSRVNKSIKWLNIPFYFVFMNLCVFAGFYRYITKKQTVLWEKVPRSSPEI